jgi:hypothetical protein
MTVYRFDTVTKRISEYAGPASSGVADPYWANVILLLNGTGSVTTESSSYNRTLTTFGTPTLDAGNSLFGTPTYKIDTAADESVRIASDTFVQAAMTNLEWCVEIHARPLNTFGQDNINSFGKFEFGWNKANNNLRAACTGLSAGSYSLSTPNGSALAGDWHHIAFVRDKSISGTWDYLRLFLDGVLVATSAAIPKAAQVDPGAGFGRLIGMNSVSAGGNYTNLRITAGSARYYSNFAPPSSTFTAPPPVITAAGTDLLSDSMYVAYGDQVNPVHGGSTVAGVWRSRRYQLPSAVSFAWARLEGPVTTGAVVRLYGDGVLVYTTPTITSLEPFRVRAIRAKRWEIEVESVDRIVGIRLGQSIEELQ